MAIQDFLSTLEKVKSTGRGKLGNTWTALCPSHSDKRPSLTITEKEDGVILVKCWSGCSAAEIIQSVGLNFEDLYPPRQIDHRGKPVKRPWNPYDVMKCLESEALVAWLIANEFHKTGAITPESKDRLWKSAMALNGAAEKCRG